jgi:hypothetical protein
MKGLGNSIAQFAAIVMIMITLAISTAAIWQWLGGDADEPKPVIALAQS